MKVTRPDITSPGFAFASAISSRMLVSLVSGLVTTTIGRTATLLTGAKSLNGSYFTRFSSRIGFTSNESEEKSMV